MATTFTPECASCPVQQGAPLRRLGGLVLAHAPLVVLAGNPNTGKSTVFNALTGLRQHTGNWPGKTVVLAEGAFRYRDRTYRLLDLPGTYSLLATSPDEEVARDALLLGSPAVTVVVLDATALERNLYLAFQVLEITPRVVLCVNLLDEARKQGYEIDLQALEAELGVPVVGTAARSGEGLPQLLAAIDAVARGERVPTPRKVLLGLPQAAPARELARELELFFGNHPALGWLALRWVEGDPSAASSLRALAQSVGFSGDPEKLEALLIRGADLAWAAGPSYSERLVEAAYGEAARIRDRAVRTSPGLRVRGWTARLDRIVTSRRWGVPLMLTLLALVFWITIAGANVPSELLSTLLIDRVHPFLRGSLEALGAPFWAVGLLVDGVYLATAWVVSVMLPPMAIFFPLFTLLEDFGLLPRLAFHLDSLFRRFGGHGKQALTMAMGWGCNAAGVVATRILDSPRERLIAILTNNFSLCNGRWPTQILLASVFVGALVPPIVSGVVAALVVVGVALFGVLLALLSSWALSRTVLRGEVSVFSLELPPYRPPQLWRTLATSVVDRTLIVLGRAVAFAAPAGAALWLAANVGWGGSSLAEKVIAFLDPFGQAVGLSGIILTAYLFAIPANEIVIPSILMLTVLVRPELASGPGAGVLFELETFNATGQLLQASGWTLSTAVCLMLFSLVHNPCSTTLFTIYRETQSLRWTALAGVGPVLLGFGLCALVAALFRLGGWG